MQRWTPALPGALVAISWLAAAEPDLSGPVAFSRHIRPLLSENCFQCHGPDRNQRRADLELQPAWQALQVNEALAP